MANQISNYFCITALQSGESIHGSLRVSGSLSQNFNPTSQKCVPDWKADAGKRPVVYPVVRRGTAYVSESGMSRFSWKYNDIRLQFDGSGYSTMTDAFGSPIFKKGSTNVSLDGNTYTVPTLTIVSNLASQTNLDMDTIVFEGSVEIAGRQVSFAAQVDVKIAQMTVSGFLGQLNPESGILSSQTDQLTVKALLYGDSGELMTTFFTRWYFGGEEDTNKRGKKEVTITGQEVTDNLIIRCDFYLDDKYKNIVSTAFASIDDTQDEESLYISYDNANSDYSGYVAEGETIEVSMWVATREDPNAIKTNYNNFSADFYNGRNEEITSSLPVISVSGHRGSMSVTHGFVTSNYGKVFGFIYAS